MNSILMQTLLYFSFTLSWVGMYICLELEMGQKYSIGIKLCYTIVLWTFFLFLITEILSILNCISRLYIIPAWAVLLTVELIFIATRKSYFSSAFCGIKENVIHAFSVISSDVASLMMLTVIIIILLRSTIIAVFTVPNNWDSMTYHLSRIFFWIEHRNVDYYFTNIERQLFSPVIAEYINLHVISITNGDIYVNLLQNWASYGCSILVFDMLIMITGSRRSSLFGVILILTMNIFNAESVSTQTDIVASLFVLICIRFIMDIYYDYDCLKAKLIYVRFITIGISLGLLYGVKSIAVVPVAIVFIFILIYCLIKEHNLILLKLSVILFISALVIVLPVFVRNYRYCGNIFAMDYYSDIAIGSFHPRFLFLNFFKNYFSAATFRGSVPVFSEICLFVSRLLNLDINSEEISFGNSLFHLKYSMHMDDASAPILMFFLFLSMIISIYMLLKKSSKNDIFNSVLLFQFLITTSIIRWQPWVVRLMLPSLVLSAIPIAYFIRNMWIEVFAVKRRINNREIVPNLFLAFSLFVFICANGESCRYLEGFVNFNPTNRFRQYFAGRVNGDPYDAICTIIDENAYNTLGIFSGDDSYQYPILARYFNRINIENVMLNDYSVIIDGDTDFVPDAIFVANKNLKNSNTMYWRDYGYRCKYYQDEYSLWEKIDR